MAWLLGVLTILAILLGVLLDRSARTASLVVHEWRLSQARLMSISAWNHLDTLWKSKDKDWTSLEVSTSPRTAISFLLRIDGPSPWPRVTIVGKDTRGTVGAVDSTAGWLASRWISDSMPVLMITDSLSGLSLAHGARIEGRVAMYRGWPQISSHYRMPAEGAHFTGSIEDSTAGSWSRNRLDTAGWNGWLEAQKIADSLVLDSGLLQDTILIAKKIRVGQHCRLRRVQLIATDTMVIGRMDSSAETSLFVVSGRLGTDSRLVSRMVIDGYKGSGVFVVLAGVAVSPSAGASLETSPNSVVSGVAWVEGWIDIQGTWRGNIVARGTRFEEDGTTWQGYLRRGILAAARDSSWLTPWMVPRQRFILVPRGKI